MLGHSSVPTANGWPDCPSEDEAVVSRTLQKSFRKPKLGTSRAGKEPPHSTAPPCFRSGPPARIRLSSRWDKSMTTRGRIKHRQSKVENPCQHGQRSSCALTAPAPRGGPWQGLSQGLPARPIPSRTPPAPAPQQHHELCGAFFFCFFCPVSGGWDVSLALVFLSVFQDESSLF